MTAALGLIACVPEAKLPAAGSAPPPGGGPPPSGVPGTSNSSPLISGTPGTSVFAGATYSFTPSASDPDGDALSFTISGKPDWATFTASSGALVGTAQQGTYAGILITVSDGEATRSLGPFTITVAVAPQSAAGSATLSWAIPGQYTDGSALPVEQLVGYRIYHGTTSTVLNQIAQLESNSTTNHVVQQLAPGTHFFAVTAVSATGTESALSQVASKTIM